MNLEFPLATNLSKYAPIIQYLDYVAQRVASPNTAKYQRVPELIFPFIVYLSFQEVVMEGPNLYLWSDDSKLNEDVYPYLHNSTDPNTGLPYTFGVWSPPIYQAGGKSLIPLNAQGIPLNNDEISQLVFEPDCVDSGYASYLTADPTDTALIDALQERRWNDILTHKDLMMDITDYAASVYYTALDRYSLLSYRDSLVAIVYNNTVDPFTVNIPLFPFNQTRTLVNCAVNVTEDEIRLELESAVRNIRIPIIRKDNTVTEVLGRESATGYIVSTDISSIGGGGGEANVKDVFSSEDISAADNGKVLVLSDGSAPVTLTIPDSGFGDVTDNFYWIKPVGPGNQLVFNDANVIVKDQNSATIASPFTFGEEKFYLLTRVGNSGQVFVLVDATNPFPDHTLGEHSDTNIAGIQQDEVISFDGSEFVPAKVISMYNGASKILNLDATNKLFHYTASGTSSDIEFLLRSSDVPADNVFSLNVFTNGIESFIDIISNIITIKSDTSYIEIDAPNNAIIIQTSDGNLESIITSDAKAKTSSLGVVSPGIIHEVIVDDGGIKFLMLSDTKNITIPTLRAATDTDYMIGMDSTGNLLKIPKENIVFISNPQDLVAGAILEYDGANWMVTSAPTPKYTVSTPIGTTYYSVAVLNPSLNTKAETLNHVEMQIEITNKAGSTGNQILNVYISDNGNQDVSGDTLLASMSFDIDPIGLNTPYIVNAPSAVNLGSGSKYIKVDNPTSSYQYQNVIVNLS